eukprot:3186575-Prymnesium_polylepis.1
MCLCPGVGGRICTVVPARLRASRWDEHVPRSHHCPACSYRGDDARPTLLRCGRPNRPGGIVVG